MAKKAFAVIGIGRFGQSVVEELIKDGADVLVIDKDPEIIAKMSKIASHAVALDSTDAESLKEVGISSIDHVIVAIGKDIQASILTTLVLKDLGVKMLTVKVQNDDHSKVVAKLGANEIIQPEKQTGIRLARKVVSTNVLDYFDLNEDHSFIVVKTTKKIIGSTIVDLDLRNKFNINVVAIRKDDDIFIPNADSEIHEAEELLIVGSNVDLASFNSWLLK